MSAIKYALDRVFLEIPIDVLNLAFMRKADVYKVNTTISQQIENLVLEPIVLTDINILGGMSLSIDLNACSVNYYELNYTNRNVVINVPFEATNNKKIINALSVTSNQTNSSTYNTTTNQLLNLAYDKLQNDGKMQQSVVYTNLELIGPNTILLHDNAVVLTNGFLSVLVENNKNLNNIQPASYPNFSEMVTLAVKAYIYNKLVIELDKGAIYYGHDINKVGDIVSDYADALEDYKTFLKEKWAKISFMNDNVSYSRFLKAMINPNI